MAGKYQTITLPDGDKYVGEVKDGLPHGKGTKTSPYGAVPRCVYIGGFKDGEFHHGQLTQYFASGNKRISEWKDGKSQGGQHVYE